MQSLYASICSSQPPSHCWHCCSYKDRSQPQLFRDSYRSVAAITRKAVAAIDTMRPLCPAQGPDFSLSLFKKMTADVEIDKNRGI